MMSGAIDKEVDSLARTIWDYHLMHHTLSAADIIMVLCSNDLRVADRAAEVFYKGFAPLIMVSGGKGELTKKWKTSEAEVFQQRLLALGVLEDNILLETASTNTGENITYSRELLEDRGISPKKVIAVQKPYMERRTYATFKKVWPEVDVIVTSPDIPYEEYFTEELPREKVISILVGDLQRIKEYPAKGFQIPQDIPENVWSAYERLVEAGYTSHLVN